MAHLLRTPNPVSVPEMPFNINPEHPLVFSNLQTPIELKLKTVVVNPEFAKSLGCYDDYMKYMKKFMLIARQRHVVRQGVRLSWF